MRDDAGRMKRDKQSKRAEQSTEESKKEEQRKGEAKQ